MNHNIQQILSKITEDYFKGKLYDLVFRIEAEQEDKIERDKKIHQN